MGGMIPQFDVALVKKAYRRVDPHIAVIFSLHRV
jgi:hypothetical protein